MQMILSPQQMRDLENHAFSLGVSDVLLMEEAARAAHQVMVQVLGSLLDQDILYLVGLGNNGGDGLCMARLCMLAGGRPRILILGEPKTQSNAINLAYARALGIPVQSMEEGSVCSIQKPQAVVDALYGIGFRDSLPLYLHPLVEQVNTWQVPCFAIDIPSGMDGLTGAVQGPVVKASHCLVPGHLKTGLCLSTHPYLVGQMHLLPLGLPAMAYDALMEESIITALEVSDLPLRLPRRARHLHKGQAGRVLLYMGSLGMAGAAAMAAQACLMAGAGLVTIACPADIIPTLQTLVPNAMCQPITEAIRNPPRYDVLALGCGLSQSDAIWQDILALYDPGIPSIWDADALNLLAKHPMKLGEKAIISPHPGEAARLLGISTEEVSADPLAAAARLSQAYACSVVLKGAVSIITDGQDTAFNLSGSPALAKGGSGDALAGVIAALLAQNQHESAFVNAQTACFWFGLAGELAASRYGERSVLTSQVIACLGQVLQDAAAQKEKRPSPLG